MSLSIEQTVLTAARAFFERRGAAGCEGTAMIAAVPTSGSRLVIPDQTAGSYPRCWVEVTERGKLDLAAALKGDELYVARIHSHPGNEPHSLTDDRNPALTFDGAMSIVVPYFGLALRRGLEACRCYRRSGGSWLEIGSDELGDYLMVVR